MTSAASGQMPAHESAQIANIHRFPERGFHVPKPFASGTWHSATFNSRNESFTGRPGVSLLEQPTRLFSSRGWSAMGNIPKMRLLGTYGQPRFSVG